MTKKADLPRNPGVPRRNNTQQILNAAEKIFSAYGFAGARIDDIAKACDLPKANILYYFGSKEELYRATLQRLLVGWLADADQWISIKHTPAVGLEGYIRSKMAFSRSKPDASRLFMHELLAGGRGFARFLIAHCASTLSRKLLFLIIGINRDYARLLIQLTSCSLYGP